MEACQVLGSEPEVPDLRSLIVIEVPYDRLSL